MKEIYPYDFDCNSNEEHYSLHTRILDLVIANPISYTHLKDLMSKYEVTLMAENDCIMGIKSNKDIPDIEKTDKTRNKIYTCIIGFIEIGLCSTIKVRIEAAQLLDNINRIQLADLKFQSGEAKDHIEIFIEEVRKDKYLKSSDILGLEEYLVELYKVNEKYITGKKQIGATTISWAAHKNIKKLRQRVDAAYLEIAKTINTLYQKNALVTKSKAIEQAIDTVIDSVNALIIQQQQALLRTDVD